MNMKALLGEIQEAVSREYHRATTKFGPANNSPHESYAVILEELEEAQSEAKMFECVLGNIWKNIKENNAKSDGFSRLLEIAERAAAEWVQVAAMCHKATIRKDRTT